MRAITTKYLGPTDKRQARIRAQSEESSKTIPYDHSVSADQNHDAAALALSAKLGWHGELIRGGLGSSRRVYVWAVAYCLRRSDGEVARISHTDHIIRTPLPRA